jgi:hypothetical protein
MSQFNPDYWELPTDSAALERLPSTSALWFETPDDRERRYAMQNFYQAVTPVVDSLIESELTRRQREVLKLYYLYGKTQEDIAVILNLTQSTVSRHLFGTVRRGKKVGGAITKLRKAIDRVESPVVNEALDTLQSRLAQAV